MANRKNTFTGRGRGPGPSITKKNKTATFTKEKKSGSSYTFNELKTVGFINEIFQLGKLMHIRHEENRTLFDFMVNEKTYEVWSTTANTAAITNVLKVGFSYEIKGTIYADKKHRYRSASNTMSNFNFGLSEITQVVSEIPGEVETVITTLTDIKNMIAQSQTFTKTVANVKITNATIYRYMGCESCTRSLSTQDKKVNGKYFCSQCTKTRGGEKQRKLCMIARLTLACVDSSVEIDNIVCYHSYCVEFLGTKLVNNVCSPTRSSDTLARIVAEKLIGNQISCQIRNHKPKARALQSTTALRSSVREIQMANHETIILMLNRLTDVDDGNHGQIIPEICHCEQCGGGESQHEDDEEDDNDDEMEIEENTSSIQPTSTAQHNVSLKSMAFITNSNEQMNTSSNLQFNQLNLNLLPEEHYKLNYNQMTKSYGSALIINMDFADGKFQKPREGSKNDVRALQDMFKQLKINIFETKENISEKELMDAIDRFKMHLQNTNSSCSFFVIMTHGTQNFIRTQDNRRVNIYTKILIKFSEQQFEKFSDNPKVFIFNACQNANKENDKDYEKIGFSHAWPNQDNLTHAIICTPCLPGQSAKRSPKKGSHFIQSMTKIFCKYAKRAHLEQMLHLVQKDMQKKPVGKGKTEINIPNFTPLVFKRFMFPAVELQNES